jgi:hypothetical protein
VNGETGRHGSARHGTGSVVGSVPAAVDRRESAPGSGSHPAGTGREGGGRYGPRAAGPLVGGRTSTSPGTGRVLRRDPTEGGARGRGARRIVMGVRASSRLRDVRTGLPLRRSAPEVHWCDGGRPVRRPRRGGSPLPVPGSPGAAAPAVGRCGHPRRRGQDAEVRSRGASLGEGVEEGHRRRAEPPPVRRGGGCARAAPLRSPAPIVDAPAHRGSPTRHARTVPVTPKAVAHDAILLIRPSQSTGESNGRSLLAGPHASPDRLPTRSMQVEGMVPGGCTGQEHLCFRSGFPVGHCAFRRRYPDTSGPWAGSFTTGGTACAGWSSVRNSAERKLR